MKKNKSGQRVQILESERGLSAKNWAWLEIFLNRIGRRVDFYERKGLFCKIYGADRYLPELTWAETVLGRSIWIGWPRCVWARGAAALLAGAEAPAAEAHRTCLIWPSGGRIERALAWDGIRSMRNPPGPRARGGEAQDEVRQGGGGSARRRNNGERRSGLGKGPRASNSSA